MATDLVEKPRAVKNEEIHSKGSKQEPGSEALEHLPSFFLPMADEAIAKQASFLQTNSCDPGKADTEPLLSLCNVLKLAKNQNDKLLVSLIASCAPRDFEFWLRMSYPRPGLRLAAATSDRASLIRVYCHVCTLRLWHKVSDGGTRLMCLRRLPESMRQ
jgi:hypothetical protein